MHLTFQRQVLLGISFSILLVLAVGYVSYNAILIQQENTAWVDHTREVMRVSTAVKNRLLTAEANVRGFAITGNKTFETVYLEASRDIWNDVGTLRKLVKDNKAQSARVDSLSVLLENRVGIMSRQYEILKTEKYSIDTIQRIVLQGKDVSLKIEFSFRRIENVEEGLLTEREQLASMSSARAKQYIVMGSALFFLVILLLYYLIRKTYLAQVASEQATQLANKRLEQLGLEDQEKNWILNAAMEVSSAVRGEPTLTQLSERLLSKLAEVTESQVSAMYLVTRSGEVLERSATYGISEAAPSFIPFGEGILGQFAVSKENMKRLDVSAGYMQVKTATGSSAPGVVLLKNIAFEGQTAALIEIGYLKEPGAKATKLLDMISDNVAVAIMAARAREIAGELLEKTQLQAEELESQQEELRVTNEELTRQTSLLQVSEEELRVQQEELKQINTELEEKAFMLEEQKRTIEEARDQIQNKADELERSGRFKSEFLANMSHELRTPLNSILILSRILGENKGARLNDEEQRYASVIYNSGNDLLTLINDILDLAKVEAGKIELIHEQISAESVLAEVKNTFQKVAENKGLVLQITKAGSCPEMLFTDHTRLLQILRNLISNAVKFTSAPGKVSLTISKEGDQLHFEVADTGIGIPLDKQASIFEAFQQADGSTSRKFGGTGLGLSISRELAALFSGSISLRSVPGEGSVFTLKIPYLAESDEQPAGDRQEVVVEPAVTEGPASRPSPSENGKARRLLLIEDDAVFAADMAAKAQGSGFAVQIAANGREALEMVSTFSPTAIILDMHLPDIPGEEVLKALKSDTRTRLIPVHTVSSGDFFDDEMVRNGAIGFMQKPVDERSAQQIFTALKLEGKDLDRQRILLIEDDAFQSKYLGDFLSGNNIFVLYAYSAAEALHMLESDRVDGIILDVRLADMNGLDLLDKIKENPQWNELPVVVNTAEDLTQADLGRVMKYAHPVVIKTKKSNERLLDEVKLFLKKIQPRTQEPEVAGESFSNAVVNAEQHFAGKKLLLADDDMRNIFALSAVLEDAGFSIEIATNGKEAINKLEDNPEIELILMDVMMPEMDGIEATRRIRQVPRWANIPIIAVTAKAMQGDREQCLEAGANDYISKPVDVDKLLSLIKVWLHA
ncbi:response regulator [Dyadobacter endophyticus]|uniref:response regulator n=1 Tax=Dyadobacter endophyticus TaxID=1749036 RepID=UPI003CEACF6E